MARSQKSQSSSCGSLFLFLLFILFNLFSFFEEASESEHESKSRPRQVKMTLARNLAQYSDERLIEMLDQPGFKGKKDRSNGRNLLHIACEINRPKFAGKLIEQGFSIDQTDNQSFTPIMIALKHDAKECVEMLMEKQPDLKIGTRNRLPIHYAADKGYLKVVKESLRQGVNIETATRVGRYRPLHLAARGGHFDIAVLLAENGADLSVSMGMGWSAGDLAFSKNRRISMYLQNKGGSLSIGQLTNEFQLVDGWPLPRPDEIKNNINSEESLLFKAVVKNDLATLEKAGANHNFDALSKAGTPLLCFALLNKKSEAAEIILSRVKQIDLVDGAQRTALLCAIIGEDERLAGLILKKGANPNKADMTGNTALHYAISLWYNQLVPELITAGAEVFAINLLQQGPLHIAVENGNLQIVEFLIQNGCDVDLDDARGNTALHLAVIAENLAMVQRLLKNGANPYVKNLAGSLPIDLARGKNQAIFELLNNRSEIEGLNPVLRAPAEINLRLPKVKNSPAERN